MINRKLLILLLLKIASASEWNYQGLGIDHWAGIFPACRGILQSPINIKESKAIFNSRLGHINFHNYDSLFSWNISHNNYTIVVNKLNNQSLTPYITGSNFKPGVKYYLSQFHFHWGSNIFEGSEHHIDYQTFPLEVHFVHISDSNEIAVIGFLFEIDNRDNENLKTLINEVGRSEIKSSLASFRPDLLIPEKRIRDEHGYFRYIGSLTTPPCTEGIIWTVYRSKIKISEAQMKQFYKNEIEFNNRDIQELNNRTLYISVRSMSADDTETRNFFLIIIQNIFNFFLRFFSFLF